eukprot:91107_1
MAALNLAALRQQVNTDDSNESVVNSIVRRLSLPRFRANGQFDEVLNRINTFTAVVTTLPDMNNGQPNFHYQQSDAVKNAQRDLINKPAKTDDDVRMANELIRIKGAIYVEIIIPLLTRLKAPGTNRKRTKHMITHKRDGSGQCTNAVQKIDKLIKLSTKLQQQT